MARQWEKRAMTKAKYKEARTLLDRLNKEIDDAPADRKPVFKGIVELHDAIMQYEHQRR